MDLLCNKNLISSLLFIDAIFCYYNIVFCHFALDIDLHHLCEPLGCRFNKIIFYIISLNRLRFIIIKARNSNEMPCFSKLPSILFSRELMTYCFLEQYNLNYFYLILSLPYSSLILRKVKLIL